MFSPFVVGSFDFFIYAAGAFSVVVILREVCGYDYND